MDSVKGEQIGILAAHRVTVAIGAVAAGVLTLGVLWNSHDVTRLLIWFIALASVAFVRWWIARRISILGGEAYKNEWLIFCLIGSAFVNGVVWGALLLLFFPDDPLALALLLGLHASYISAAASSTSIYLPVFYLFSITSSVLLFIGLLLAGVEQYWPFAALTVLYVLVSVQLGLKNNIAFTEQIRLRYENNALMAEVIDQRDRAESAMRAKNSFLAAASHDLRQPVHALGLFVDSLESYQQSESALKILDKIRQATGSLGSLFHGLLDLSKLDAGIVENEPQQFELDYLLESLKSEFQGLAAEKNLLLKIPTNTRNILNVDPELLERIVRNLISNAIKYTSSGEVELRITPVPGHEVRIDVVDTGHGIPEAEQQNIFSEYYQLENPERDRQRGIGLGLSIVRRLCEIMEIPLMVQSEVGRGSTFSVVVPQGDVHKLAKPRALNEQLDIDLAGQRVIVIDDELPILEGMHAILSSWGCDVITADSSAVAIEKLKAFGTPDILIADLRLRNNENGLDTIRAIRDRFRKEIPAILVTGDIGMEQLQQTLVASVQVLHKPVSPSKLRTAIVDQMIA